VDDDCDGVIDNGYDMDGDGQTTCRGDCDDTDPAVYAGATEVCDGIDDDCDPSTSDDGDLDGDGWTRCDGDCDDGDAAAHPGATEVCDGVDDDCNGAIDELPECYSCTEDSGYLVCPGAATWDEGEAVCESFGRTLAVIGDADENTIVAGLASTYTGTSVWFGYTDVAVEGTFVWVDGSDSACTNWNAGEPNDSGGEDCACINYAAIGGWNDYPCSSPQPFICE
jgi:hypothetical protein